MLKKQPLTLMNKIRRMGHSRGSSHDIPPLFTLQSIPEQHFKRNYCFLFLCFKKKREREQPGKPSKPLWQIDYMWRPIRACSLEVSICHWKVLFESLSATLTGRGQWIEGIRKLLWGEVVHMCWMTSKEWCLTGPISRGTAYSLILEIWRSEVSTAISMIPNLLHQRKLR